MGDSTGGWHSYPENDDRSSYLEDHIRQISQCPYDVMRVEAIRMMYTSSYGDTMNTSGQNSNITPLIDMSHLERKGTNADSPVASPLRPSGPVLPRYAPSPVGD